jgi:acetyl esterase
VFNVLGGALQTVARVFGPTLRAGQRKLEVLRGVRYGASDGKHHLLDVYRPKDRSGPLPAILYLHGGGFVCCSKETHAVFAQILARRGYVVFLPNYRLAPRHRYPGAHADSAAAMRWVFEHGGEYGADLDRVVVAGESAGANLALTLAVASSYRRAEPFAHAVHEHGSRVRGFLAFYGLHQVSQPERIAELGGRGATVRALRRLARAYLGPDGGQRGAGLFDPLLVLEHEAPDRPLSPLFVAAGTGDALFDDSRRLALAAEQHNGTVIRSFEQGQPHAFNIMLWKRAARRCWQATFEFLDAVTKPQSEPLRRTA